MRRFIFSGKLESGDAAVVRALTPTRVTCRDVVLVETAIPEVAALLATLDTVEEIPAEVISTAADWKAKIKREKKSKRQSATGPLVECPVCHEMRPAEQMTKAGPCKVCHMRELRAEKSRQNKSQAIKKSQPAQELQPAEAAPVAPLHSALPPKPEHTQENRQERLARPREKINLAGLSGRKVG